MEKCILWSRETAKSRFGGVLLTIHFYTFTKPASNTKVKERGLAVMK